MWNLTDQVNIGDLLGRHHHRDLSGPWLNFSGDGVFGIDTTGKTLVTWSRAKSGITQQNFPAGLPTSRIRSAGWDQLRRLYVCDNAGCGVTVFNSDLSVAARHDYRYPMHVSVVADGYLVMLHCDNNNIEIRRVTVDGKTHWIRQVDVSGIPRINIGFYSLVSTNSRWLFIAASTRLFLASGDVDLPNDCAAETLHLITKELYSSPPHAPSNHITSLWTSCVPDSNFVAGLVQNGNLVPPMIVFTDGEKICDQIESPLTGTGLACISRDIIVLRGATKAGLSWYLYRML